MTLFEMCSFILKIDSLYNLGRFHKCTEIQLISELSSDGETFRIWELFRLAKILNELKRKQAVEWLKKG